MTLKHAIRLASAWSQGHVCTLRDGEAEEYHKMALEAFRAMQWREQLWHDVKADPPPRPGLYYGAIDDTNSMWAVRYRDGVWVMSAHPEQKMDIVRWADYGAFENSDD